MNYLLGYLVGHSVLAYYPYPPIYSVGNATIVSFL